MSNEPMEKQMTREDYKAQYALAKTDVRPLIDKIYDQLEQERNELANININTTILLNNANRKINDFESRVCENCKFFLRGLKGSIPNRCEDNSSLSGIIDKSFGCNRFKRKPER